MIKAIIFDLWDTLVPSTVDFKKLISLLNLEHLSREDFIKRYECSTQLKKFASFSKLHKSFLAEFKKEDFVLSEEEFRLVYCGRVKKYSFFPEVRRTLISLGGLGFKLGILSNTENLITAELERELLLGKYFDALCYSFDVGAIKPDKKAFSFVLSKLKVKPHEALMVGDSLRSDIFGSARMGLHNCLINRSGKVLDYSVAKPEFEIKSLVEVKKVVGELNAP